MRAAVVATAMCLSAVGLAAASDTWAAVRKSTHIPAQGLGPALQVLAKEHGFQLVYRPEFVRDRRTAGAVGELTSEEALSQLLQGTGLAHRRLDEKTVTIVPLPDAASDDLAAAAPFGIQSSGPAIEEASQEQKKRGFLARFRRLAQADQRTSSDGRSSIGRPAAAADSHEPVEIEEVIVSATGTRIRGSQTGASPSYSFDREDFAAAGATSVQQMMRTLPQNFTGGNTETGSVLASGRNGGGGNLSFGAGINLRGLGNGSTLVLLNGRRMAPGGSGSFVDVSAIPLSALERIDVLPDGASAIYGSDAVGGVVNFILRDNFHGAETNVRYGAVTDGGLRELSANQLAGATWDSGSVLVNVDYGSREPLLTSERGYASALAQAELTYLTPDDERLGALVNGHQDLSSTLSLSALLYANARDVRNETFINSQRRQMSAEGTSDQVGGTLALTWKASETWTVTLAHTDSRSDSERESVLRASATAPAAPSGVRTEHEMQATELGAEGAIFSAPGGVVRLAMGGDRREEYLKEVRAPGSTSPRGETSFARTVDAAYAELFVPLVGDGNQASGVRRLDLTAAIRHEDYDDVGSSDNWKFGAVWLPVDGLKLRATHGTSFRAPYLYQFQTALGFAYLFEAPNPAEPDGSTLVAAVSLVPALDLGPENATIWTAGLDVEPSLLGGFRVSATYFSIDYEDRIAAATLTPTPFGNPSLAGLISMPPDPGIIAQIGALDPNRIYRLGGTTAPLSAVQATFDGRTRNQARTEVSGVDLVVGRSFDTTVGNFDLGVSASYLLSFDTQQVSTAPNVNIVDTIFNPVDLRARAHAVFTNAGWSLSAFVNYIDGYTDDQVATLVPVSSWTTVDLGVAYSFSRAGWLEDVTLRANAINAFNQRPPEIIDRAPAWGNPGYDTENANPLGRVLSVQVSKRW